MEIKKFEQFENDPFGEESRLTDSRSRKDGWNKLKELDRVVYRCREEIDNCYNDEEDFDDLYSSINEKYNEILIGMDNLMQMISEELPMGFQYVETMPRSLDN